jgi:hypothetical protein
MPLLQFTVNFGLVKIQFIKFKTIFVAYGQIFDGYYNAGQYLLST